MGSVVTIEGVRLVPAARSDVARRTSAVIEAHAGIRMLPLAISELKLVYEYMGCTVYTVQL